MKNAIKFANLLLLILLLTTFSCSKDDEVKVTILQDLEVTIDENPADGQVIGTVQDDGSGTLTFSITSQTPAGALSIGSGTGELTVADASLFDFETNPVITATVSAEGAENTATVTVNLTNINEIGDFNHGGVVFWIDPTDNSKGLVCAVEDQSTSVIWGSLDAAEVTGTSASLGSGSANTDLIIASKGTGTNHAAGVARAYAGGGFNDWFLPSHDEFLEMYSNKDILNTTATANSGEVFQEGATLGAMYWVSNVIGVNGNFLFNFYSGSVNGVYPINARNVRAARAFTD